MAGKLFVATDTFFAADEPVRFVAYQTLVREGHPILEKYPDKFREASAQYEWPDVEQATAAPGEKRAYTRRS
jgi:hypothetical protein